MGVRSRAQICQGTASLPPHPDMEEHSDFSSPDEDYGLFILIVVSSFIIPSFILICFEDSISDVTQYKQIQQSLLMYPQGTGAQLYSHQTGAMLYQDLQHHDTADVCRSYEEENRRELYDMGDNIETVPEEEFYEEEEVPSYLAVDTQCVLSQIMKDRLKDFVKIQPNGEIQLNMAEQISVTL